MQTRLDYQESHRDKDLERNEDTLELGQTKFKERSRKTNQFQFRVTILYYEILEIIMSFQTEFLSAETSRLGTRTVVAPCSFIKTRGYSMI